MLIGVLGGGHVLGEIVTPDPETAALLRAVLEELCATVSPSDARVRTDVASGLLEAIKQGAPSVDELKKVGREALRQPPTMWR